MGNMKNKEKVRQYRSNQGRSPQQMRSNEIAAFVSVIGLISMFAGIALYNCFK
tara:strand:+ start:329 stop:487 length:159 start_codon:yes stop_codon:yes gene_type:complete